MKILEQFRLYISSLFRPHVAQGLNISKKDIKKEYRYVIEDARKLPIDYQYCIFNSADIGDYLQDYHTPMVQGKKWLYELTTLHQPKTGLVLSSVGDLFLFSSGTFEAYRKGKQDDFIGHLAQEVSGTTIQIIRFFYGDNPSDDNYQAPNDILLCLPDPIRLAYYHRFMGLSVLRSVVPGISSNLLPRHFHFWIPIGDYLSAIRKKKKYLPFLMERFPDLDMKAKVIAFECFLNWGDETSADLLFVKTKNPDKKIYYIRDHDVPNMSILSDPVEAIDSYCEHILLRREGRFDFRPWSVPCDEGGKNKTTQK